MTHVLRWREGVAVQARGVVVVRGGRRVVDDVDVDVEPGRLLAVTGPSGSGKSTLLAVLAGLVTPDEGTVSPADRSGRTGIVLQGYGLLPVLTASENVELPLQLRGVDPGEIRARAQEALERAGLDEAGDRLAEELSGGQRQRVAVARALVSSPGCSSPTSPPPTSMPTPPRSSWVPCAPRPTPARPWCSRPTTPTSPRCATRSCTSSTDAWSRRPSYERLERCRRRGGAAR